MDCATQQPLAVIGVLATTIGLVLFVLCMASHWRTQHATKPIEVHTQAVRRTSPLYGLPSVQQQTFEECLAQNSIGVKHEVERKVA